MAWPGSDWARPVFQASDIGNISVTARGQKSFLVAVSQPGPRQNFRMDSHPSTLAVGSQYTLKICRYPGFPGGAVVESLPANAGDTGSSPGLGGSRMPRSS